MAIIQSIPISGSGSTYTNMTTDEAIAGTNTEERVISAKVLNDAIDNKIPTIPTVNNATLTIQKNGTTVKTFTANSSTNVTCNIEIPTKVSDLTNDSGFIADVSGKADKATTLSGYGITDAYTKSQVDKKVSDLVNSAPETLDTLNELANALGNDPNFATTVATQIGTKANDANVVHKSGDETIAGIKKFSDILIGIDNFNIQSGSDWDGGARLTLNKKTESMSAILQTFSNTDSSAYVYDVNNFYPFKNNNNNLGTSTNKWKDVYATTFHGDVDFPITEAQVNEILGIA